MLHIFHRMWCEALSSKISPWRARRAKSALPTQKSTSSFFSRFVASNTSFRKVTEKYVPIEYLSSSQKCLFFLKNSKIVWNVGVRKFIFVAKKFMSSLKSVFLRFRHLELNFEENRDKEWASFAI